MPVYHTPAGPVEMLEWGDGPTLVLLLHASAAGPGSLSGLARALAEPDRRIVAPALHGYGATDVTADGDRLDAHVAVARACLDRFAASRRVVIGHSMGGMVALLAEPAVDAMVLYEPITLACLDPDDPEDAAARAWDREIVAALTQAVADGDAEPGIARFVAAWNEMSWPALPDSVRARLLAAAPGLAAEIRAGADRALRLDRIAAPVTVLQGAMSPAITHRMTARLAAALPRATRTVLEGCGHMGPVQRADAIAAVIRQRGVLA